MWRSATSAMLRREPERPLAPGLGGMKKRDSISGLTGSPLSVLLARDGEFARRC